MAKIKKTNKKQKNEEKTILNAEKVARRKSRANHAEACSTLLGKKVAYINCCAAFLKRKVAFI